MVVSGDSRPLLPDRQVDELYEETTRQQRWLSATAEVTRHLLAGAELSDALAMITEKALDMTDAELVMVTLPMADGRHQRIEHAAGDGAQAILGLVVPMHDAVTELVVGKVQRLTICDYGSAELTGTSHSLHLGPMVVVPLGAPGQVRGVLSAGRRKGSAQLSEPAAEMLATFAAQASIALELAEHRRQAERMAVFEDRDRIAKDLHDLVIQRLYATGMSLQGTISLISMLEVADRVSGAVDALDDTIRGSGRRSSPCTVTPTPSPPACGPGSCMRPRRWRPHSASLRRSGSTARWKKPSPPRSPNSC